MNSVSRREFLLGISTLPYTVTAVAQSLTTDALKALRSGFGGELILPTDSVYESARRTNNHAFDRHPLLIARCTNADDVARVLEYARSKRLPIAVRSGGHCQAGRSSLDGGVVIDLSKMNAIVVDSPKAEVQCGAGVRVFEANRETAKYDLALPLGICGDVGVAGLTLGGGYGYLLGVAGLACDSLISARLVLADGRTIEVSDQKEPDLMWALRGAGANFGIVTQMRFRAHRVGKIFGGTLTFPGAAAADVAQLVNENSATLPDELALFTSILQSPDGKTVPEISVCWSGDLKQGRLVIDKLIASRIKPQADELQAMGIAELVGRGEGTDGRSCARYGIVKGKLPPVGLQAFLNPSNMPPKLGRDAAMDSLHGLATRRPPSASAAPNYAPGLGIGYLVFWRDAASNAPARQWAQSAWDRIHSYTTNAYVNMLGDESAARVREAYGVNYPHLAKLKRKYDPDNVFRSNQNILPT